MDIDLLVCMMQRSNSSSELTSRWMMSFSMVQVYRLDQQVGGVTSSTGRNVIIHLIIDDQSSQ